VTIYNCFKATNQWNRPPPNPDPTNLLSMYIAETTAMSTSPQKDQGMRISSYAFSSSVPML